MTLHAALLIDKARETCSPPTYVALAARLGVQRQNVHQWKTGSAPMAEKHLRSMCRMAGLDYAEWWLALEADHAPAEIATKVRSVLMRAGIAAVLAIATAPAMACHFAYSGLLMPIMSAGRGTLTRLLRTLERRSSRYASLPSL